MLIDAIALPSLVTPDLICNRAVIVFDVLRATTTITAALHAGVRQIRVFATVESARQARNAGESDELLCGEVDCLPPDGFDLGNSPGALCAQRHQGQTLLMATTNGTRAIYAARDAAIVFCGALVNASAVALSAARSGLDVTLLCAGTNGQIAAEDLIGAGAVVAALQQMRNARTGNDTAAIALELYQFHRNDLTGALSVTQGGQNVIRAGLEQDIAFAARLDACSMVGKVDCRTSDPRIAVYSVAAD